MRKNILVLFAMTFNCTAFARTTPAEVNVLSNQCLEKASYKIIEMMEESENGADVHLVKNEAGRVIGLTDSEDIYGNYDLSETHLDGTRATVVFHDGDAISFATVELGKKKKSCRIISVDMGQDDHD